MKETSLQVESPLGVTTYHRFMHSEPRRKRLMVMLPGLGYTCESPVLYYLRAMAHEQGWDTLSTEYGFTVARTKGDKEITMTELRSLLQQVLPHGYEEVCIAAKSIGTRFASELLSETHAPVRRLILLTPVESAIATPNGFPTLSVLGTLDPIFGKPAYLSSRERGDHQWLVLDGVNHGLNRPGNWRGSTDTIIEVVSACQEFLQADMR